MLNQTGSLIKSSQFLHSNLFPQRGSEQRKPRGSACHSKKNSTSHYSIYSRKQQPRLQSKTVKIQFNNSAKRIYPEQVIMRRKVLTTSQKFYNKKKTIVFNFIRERSETRDEDAGSRKFLRIGTRHISKMEVDYSKKEEAEEEWDERAVAARKLKSVIFRQKGKKQVRLHSKTEDFTEESSSLLVLQRKRLTSTDSFFNSLPPTLRKMTQTNTDAFNKQKTEPLFEGKAPKDDFQEFIPIRKVKAKKEPFVFGLCDKQQTSNPHKTKEKLLSYQDFLWKVNYSNGLYVVIPENETCYKAFIGSGNNCTLIRSVLKRRFWWNITEKQESCQFVWTQLKVNTVFKEMQRSSVNKANINFPIEDEGAFEGDYNPHQKIFNASDCRNWQQHCAKHRKYEAVISEKTYKHRVNFFKCKNIARIQKSSQLVVHNHLQQNYYIGNKKALFYYMRSYYELKNANVFEALPLTFHITRGTTDPHFKTFLKTYNDMQERKKKGEDIKNIWIVKPGENSNRGNGITVCHFLDDIKLRINGRERNSDGSLRTFILQKYIERPLLYKGRKFDIRHYLLITCINGAFKAYWYPQGYIRTSSCRFSLKRNSDLFTHLTNDAVQKHSEEYGKYEKGNKVSYQSFQEYLNKTRGEKDAFFGSVLPRMKSLALDAVMATYLCLDRQRKQHNFQLLGMDFMIDEAMKPWLIEINTNPCLELSCPLLSKLIPNLIEQTFRLCIDPLFPPPQEWLNGRKLYFPENPLEQLSYQLLFDELTSGQARLHPQELDRAMGKIDDQAETYQNDGNFQQPQ